jgi:hypothetical protein
MTRTIITLTIVIIFSACGNQPADKSSIQSPISNKDSNTETNNYGKTTDTIKSINRSQWTNLDYLNQDSEYPFVAEDSIIGIGIVTISDTIETYNKKLSVYNTSGKVIATVELKESDVITVYRGKTYNRHDSLNLFSPRLYITNPDYFRLAFDCTSSDNEFYTVIINRQSGETAKIKKHDKFFKFQTIEEFVDNWTGIGIDFDRSTNPLRKSPSDKAEDINNNKQTTYKIWSAEKISIKGDWIEIKIEDTEETGWIRWRKGNQILIRMYYAC